MPTELVGRCVAARDDGAGFATVWETVLRRDRLVQGIPLQIHDDGNAQLEIRLITGHRLIYNSATNGYSLWPFPPR